MPPTVLIPVNRFDRAKQRLAERFRADQREQLAIATFQTVTCAVHDAGLLSVALTPEPDRVMALACADQVVGESTLLSGLNAQLEGLAPQLGDEVLILHADLPLATGAAIRSFLDAAGDAPVALVRSPDGGTNAMLLRPPGRFPLAYGRESFVAHEAAARGAGLRTVSVESPALALDLDTPADIAALLETPGGRETPAGRLAQAFLDASI